ncbi:putative Zn-binding protein involved in type VI secretion [Variovorax boronicumulans]|uniref:M35 family metallo-endopeptidase n=1 Tax=Variovorax boronicumulans TaxID=436515 RepID=UPI0027870F12|nr:M35 family metallo-endopeptidase [Variovorax boronicumulans]MDQ0015755.1 putative Zn-binding protein involved in type VI secretion [Variovorax boronicumulans]
MMRRILVVGDPPAPGGRVLPYGGPTSELHGHRVALIGGRAYCEGCNSVGIIAKAGGPRRPQFISEAALEGDVVVCQCPVPQPLVSVLQQSATYDDEDSRAVGVAPSASVLATTAAATAKAEMAAFKKTVDAAVTHPPEAEQTENICPNMTNKDFAIRMMAIRDRAVELIANKRLPELRRWNGADQARVAQWFGKADSSLREYLHAGLSACDRVLRGLQEKNFVRYSLTALKHVNCIIEPPSGVMAAVCKPDIRTHTIAIHIDFCHLRTTSATVDSQLSTLVHEVTHFDDTFGSFDTINHLGDSLRAAKATPDKVRNNADSIAGYVVWGESYGS